MTNSAKQIVVCGAFDDIRSRDLRFLEEAARLGELTILLWSDQEIERFTGKPPKFSVAERKYVLSAIRYVGRVMPFGHATPDSLPEIPGWRPEIWADIHPCTNARRENFCRDQNMLYHVLKSEELDGFPELIPSPSAPERKKVVATGCYDWLHSGHVRFCEEISAYGDLYIIVGHDANIRLLKGKGHPLFPQEERRYAVGSIKYVKQALISSGEGWLDADPEIRRLKPDIYAVNEDGDKGGKREYCRKMGIEYLVLQRAPAEGLPKRSSTDLRGF
ncbi:MAG TPA: adenylyltransferase/cytidyltransferase family protein [Verrucomicrobiae bacterium]|nr:adenylyltransferase/cytidyltransferase family protein [Verrucomicrobiae bacterium]